MTEDVRKAFRPEFLNRLDELVVFSRLEREQIRRIVDIQLGTFAKRLARRELTIDLSDRAEDYLGEVGWDPQLRGAAAQAGDSRRLPGRRAGQAGALRGVPRRDGGGGRPRPQRASVTFQTKVQN